MASKNSPADKSVQPIDQAIGRALNLHRTGKLAQAEAAYREVLQREPAHPHALHYFGMFLHERGHTRAAIEYLERSLAAAPGDAQVENNLAGLYLFADRIADAERMFLGLIERLPEAVPSRFNLGVLYARTKRWPEAVTQLEAARARVVDLDILRELGDALIEVGRFQEAVAMHQDALGLSLGAAEQRTQLSRAYARLVAHLEQSSADRKELVAQTRNWLAIDPEDPVAAQKLADLRAGDVAAD